MKIVIQYSGNSNSSQFWGPSSVGIVLEVTTVGKFSMYIYIYIYIYIYNNYWSEGVGATMRIILCIENESSKKLQETPITISM